MNFFEEVRDKVMYPHSSQKYIVKKTKDDYDEYGAETENRDSCNNVGFEKIKYVNS